VLFRLAGGIILKITYGIEVQEGEDHFVRLIEKANSNFNIATVPGAFLVDFFPWLHHLPEWLPGMGFLRTARQWAQDTADMVEVPYAFTKEQMVCSVLRGLHYLEHNFFVVQASGCAPPSFISDLMEDEENMSTEQINDIKFAASSMYGGKKSYI
jgi:hypothetical protein